MSSSESDDGSQQQNKPADKTSQIKDITVKLKKLLENLSGARVKYHREGAKKEESKETQRHQKDGEKKDEKDIVIQLDKAEKEFKYMIGAFRKLVAFEGDISKSLDTLERNVKDIQADLSRISADGIHDGSLEQAIERNLSVLRSNLTKVKILIPLQHQVSVAGSEERRYNLQTTVASKEVLPNPYEAKQIFERGSFVKEFQDHYEDLDGKHKLCLLCFAIFPENAEVKKRLLRFWWLGERLTEPEEEDSDPKKDFVNETLEKFVKKGFIEPVAKKGKLQATSYKMHPIIRSLIIKLAMGAKFFHYDSKGNPTMDISASKKSCLVKSDQGTPAWFSKNFSESGIKPQKKNTLEKEHQQAQHEKAEPKSSHNQQQQNKPGKKEEEEQNKNMPEKEKEHRQAEHEKGETKKQSQPESSDNQQNKNKPEEEEKEKEKKISESLRIELEKQRLKNLEKLQTLFNVSKQFPDLPVELFSKMRNIGVLYLGRWESTAERHIEVENAEFLNGLKNMRKLRFFSLQGISGISKLPKSISKLTNLRILDLRACNNLEKLPKEIVSLKMLNRLDLSECYMLDNIPRQLSRLSNLQVLKGFVISKNSSCTLRNLEALKQLKKLSINVNSDEFKIDKEGEVFFKLTELRKLKIAWGAGGETASKSENGNKGKNGTKSTQKVEIAASEKSGWIKALQKVKVPWGSSGEESSKSIAEDKDEKKTSDAAIPGAAKQNSNEGEKKQEKLVKLDLQCFPRRDPPNWVVPEKLTELKHLYIRGGKLSNLGKTDSSMPGNKKWEKMETLHLKFLTDLKTNWKELQTQFPELEYLEKVKCPQITFCPCDANGVWKLKQP